MKKNCIMLMAAVALLIVSGCTTRTAYIEDGTRPEAVAGFSQDDIADTIQVAVNSLLSLNAIKAPEQGKPAVVIVDNVINDTSSRGRDAEALAEGLGISLREALTSCGKIVVYNREAAKYATVKVTPQYGLNGRLTQRNLRQDNSDIQIEYSLNLQLVELATGLEVWQKRVPLRKLAALENVY